MARLTTDLSARLWSGGNFTRWTATRGFPNSSSVPPLPGFSQRDGAHPPATKWWDFAELYDSELKDFWQLSKRLLRALCSRESTAPTVISNPTSWSEWFVQNAEMLLKVAWFTGIPDLYIRSL